MCALMKVSSKNNLVKKKCFFVLWTHFGYLFVWFHCKLQKRFAKTLIIEMLSSAEKGTRATNRLRAEQATLSAAASISDFGARQ